MTSHDLRGTERIKASCQSCGRDLEYPMRFDRDGKPYGVCPVRCPECREIQRQVDHLKYQQEHLPAEIETQKEKWFADCQLPGIFIDKASAGLDKFERILQPKAFDVIKSFDGRSIVLSSPELYGVGKTHLVCCLAWNLLQHVEAVTISREGNFRKHHCPVFFTTETALLSRIRATYNRNPDEPFAETEEDVYNKLASYQVLILDDVGKVRPKDYSFLQGVYFKIIDERYVSEQTIILTTNLGLSDLESHIGGACADRLKDMCGPGNIIKMGGKSYRGKKVNA